METEREESQKPLIKRVAFDEKYRCAKCQSSNTYITKFFKVCRKCGYKERLVVRVRGAI
jgi:ribosomal protein S14